MSSLIPSGSASGTGSMTLAAPVTNSNQTATLPDATGTVMVSGNMPAFSAYQSSAQTLSATTWTKIVLQTEEFDTANCFDSTTNYRFTPNVAGYYQFTANIAVGVVTSTVSVAFYKNGSLFKNGNQVNTNGALVQGSALIYLNGSTDYVEFYGFFVTGQATGASSYSTWFQGYLVRSA